MTDFRSLLANLSRPRLLIRAARFGLGDYRRERDLRRLVAPHLNPAHFIPERAMPHLLDVEAQLEQTRRAGDAAYSVARHIEVLIALMAEARLLPRTATPA